jgi:hypothetical protein
MYTTSSKSSSILRQHARLWLAASGQFQRGRQSASYTSRIALLVELSIASVPGPVWRRFVRGRAEGYGPTETRYRRGRAEIGMMRSACQQMSWSPRKVTGCISDAWISDGTDERAENALRSCRRTLITHETCRVSCVCNCDRKIRSLQRTCPAWFMARRFRY